MRRERPGTAETVFHEAGCIHANAHDLKKSRRKRRQYMTVGAYISYDVPSSNVAVSKVKESRESRHEERMASEGRRIEEIRVENPRSNGRLV